MYDKKLTLFCEHNHKWIPTTFNRCEIYTVVAENLTVNGVNNVGNIKMLIQADSDKTIDGKQYIGVAEYNSKEDVSNFFTFAPERDFVIEGSWEGGEGDDEDYDVGFYQYMNETRDAHMVTSAAWFGLIPHFEVMGK